MALDTDVKRASAISFNRPFERLSTAATGIDASVTDNERYMCAFCYSGISILPPAVSTFRPGGGIHPSRNRRRLGYA